MTPITAGNDNSSFATAQNFAQKFCKQKRISKSVKVIIFYFCNIF